MPHVTPPSTPERRMAHREACERYRRKVVMEAITAYGGRCARCGEECWDLLEFHHRDGGGNMDRAALFGHGHASPGGWNYCLKLKQAGWPEKIQLLCKTCHDKEHPERLAHPGRMPAPEELKHELDLMDPVPF